MAEAFNTRILAAGSAARYAEVADEIDAVLAGEPDRVARMATVAAMLHLAFAPRFIWTGFYVVDSNRPDELVVGPYQGALGCLRIAFGRGVCGTAAASGEVQRVPDVEAFPGHIACDGRSRSELVVPVRDAERRLIAVFDVDSAGLNAFDEDDEAGISRILHRVFAT